MERSRDWMNQAEGDLLHARSDLQGAYYDWACFSAQQAAEKAVKAVFQRMGAEAWGHSVADLLTELAARHTVPERLHWTRPTSRRDIRVRTRPGRRGRATRGAKLSG